ncbi:MAG TPA: hypothetical protein VGA45_09500, partial [Actinomycetota bacterium]
MDSFDHVARIPGVYRHDECRRANVTGRGDRLTGSLALQRAARAMTPFSVPTSTRPPAKVGVAK